MMSRCLLIVGLLVAVLAPGWGGVWAGNTVGNAASATLPAHIRIAFTQKNNVYLINADGSGRTAVTTRGKANMIDYFYDWSPDGKYLLLVRRQLGKGEDLLLMDQGGNLLRTLATNLPLDGFAPHWAVDGDQIAYTSSWAASSGQVPQWRATVSQIEVNGHHQPLWTYSSLQGCDFDQSVSMLQGIGLGDPAFQVTGQPSPFYWSIKRHEAIYNAGCRGLNFTDTRSGQTRNLPGWTDTAVSTKGAVAAVVNCGGASHCIALVSARSGSVIRVVSLGIEPIWSPDGSALYFFRQIPGPTLEVNQGDATASNKLQMTTASSSLWRIDANGAHLTQLTTADAYAFTWLQLTPDGRSLVFSSTDNPWQIWKHRSAGNWITFSTFYKYLPTVSIQRIDLATHKLTTVIRDASGPEVQP